MLSFLFALMLCILGAVNAVIKISETEIYQATPFGYRLSDCVHVVPSGSHIENFDTYFTINGKEQPRCHTRYNSTYIRQRMQEFTGSDPSDTGSGFQAYVKQDMGGSVTGFYGHWSVPSLPTTSSFDEIMYAFIGLQNMDWVPPQPEPSDPFDAIQPALQYGYNSGRGGGPYWGISSWYMTLTNDVVQSQLIHVSPSDAIQGILQKTNASTNDTWLINTVDTTSGLSTSFTVSRAILSKQPWVYVALEVFSITDCTNQYPPKGSSIPFQGLVLQNDFHANETVDWAVGTNGQSPPVCDAKIQTPYSNSAVTILF